MQNFQVYGAEKVYKQLNREGIDVVRCTVARLMRDHADRQSSLDRDVRIGTLAARFAAGRSSPDIEHFIRKPDGQVASTPKAGLVLGPVPQPISRLRVLALALLRILQSVAAPARGCSVLTR